MAREKMKKGAAPASSTRTKKKADIPERDELAQVIADSLNKLHKDGKVAYFLDGQEDTPTDLTDFVSTGCANLDIAISNRPHGGIAVGRITELTGLEGSGKSLLAASIIASTQRRGGVAVFIDTENAVNEEFFTAIGVDINKLVWVQHDTVEDIFDSITNIIEKVRTSGKKDRLVTIVVDSVAGASTKTEIEADFAKDGWATGKAIILSKAMRKVTNLLGRERISLVFTNQLRQKLNAPAFSDPWTTSGGKAIAFHASTRIRLSQTGKIKDSAGNVIGVHVKAVIVKNRLGPPWREVEFDIYFDRGIDDYSTWLATLKELEIVSQSGAWYSYEKEKFQAKDFPEFLEKDADRKEVLYNAMCEALIMKYKTDPESAFITPSTDDE